MTSTQNGPGRLVARHTRVGTNASFDLFIEHRDDQRTFRGTWTAPTGAEEMLLHHALVAGGFDVQCVGATAAEGEKLAAEMG